MYRYWRCELACRSLLQNIVTTNFWIILIYKYAFPYFPNLCIFQDLPVENLIKSQQKGVLKKIAFFGYYISVSCLLIWLWIKYCWNREKHTFWNGLKKFCMLLLSSSSDITLDQLKKCYASTKMLFSIKNICLKIIRASFLLTVLGI